jgi:hypothetical protein
VGKTRAELNAYHRTWRANNPASVKKTRAAYIAKYPDRTNAQQRRVRLQNPERTKQNENRSAFLQRLRNVGWTEAIYNRVWLAQGRRCGICMTLETGTKKNWHLDHDHATGKGRGILCHHCNLMLGNAKDDISRLRAGIFYLERHR